MSETQKGGNLCDQVKIQKAKAKEKASHREREREREILTIFFVREMISDGVLQAWLWKNQKANFWVQQQILNYSFFFFFFRFC